MSCGINYIVGRLATVTRTAPCPPPEIPLTHKGFIVAVELERRVFWLETAEGVLRAFDYDWVTIKFETPLSSVYKQAFSENSNPQFNIRDVN